MCSSISVYAEDGPGESGLHDERLTRVSMGFKEDSNGIGVASCGRLKERRLPITILGICVCAICQQQRQHGRVPLECRQMQRSGAVLDISRNFSNWPMHIDSACMGLLSNNIINSQTSDSPKGGLEGKDVPKYRQR